MHGPWFKVDAVGFPVPRPPDAISAFKTSNTLKVLGRVCQIGSDESCNLQWDDKLEKQWTYELKAIARFGLSFVVNRRDMASDDAA